MSERKNILIIAYSNLGTDPRVLRQINALKNDYNLLTLGYSAVEDESIEFHQIYTLPPFSLKRKLKRFFQLISGQHDTYYWDDCKKTLVEKLRDKKLDAIIANDIHTLPLALKIAEKNCKVYFDAHEYHPLEFDDNLKWKLIHRPYVQYLCKQYIPQCDVFTTLNEGIAEEYFKFLSTKPEIVTNASEYQSLTPSLVNASRIRMIHHGAANRSRKIETMIQMMDHLDENYELDLMLVGDKAYINELSEKARSYKNVRFIPPVRTEEISSHINSYDIGVYILPPTNFNNRLALPNKIFEFVQARLAIAISPNPEMERIVKTYDLGVVAKNFEASSLAESIKTLSREQIFIHKKNCDIHARALSSDANAEKLRNLVNRIIR